MSNLHHSLMSGSARQKRNARLLAASDVCHLCGHPGADEIDHVIPLARATSDAELRRLDVDPTNLRPAHGQSPCAICEVRCNRVKSDKIVAVIHRRSGSLERP